MDTEPGRAEASLQLGRARRPRGAGRDAPARWVCSTPAATRGALARSPGSRISRSSLARTRAAGLETDLRVEGDAAAVSAGARPVRVPDRPGGADQRDQARRPCPRERPPALGSATRSNSRSATTAAGRSRSTGARRGHGIAGMRERAALHGGSVHGGRRRGRRASPCARDSRSPRSGCDERARTATGSPGIDRTRLDAVAATWHCRSHSNSSSRDQTGLAPASRPSVGRRAVRGADRGPAAMACRRAHLLLGGRADPGTARRAPDALPTEIVLPPYPARLRRRARGSTCRRGLAALAARRLACSPALMLSIPTPSSAADVGAGVFLAAMLLCRAVVRRPPGARAPSAAPPRSASWPHRRRPRRGARAARRSPQERVRIGQRAAGHHRPQRQRDGHPGRRRAAAAAHRAGARAQTRS